MGIGNFFLTVTTACFQAVLESFVLFEFLEFGKLEEYTPDVLKSKGTRIFWRIVMNFLGSSLCIYTNKKQGPRKSLLITSVFMLITISSVYFSKETETRLLILSATIGMATSAAPVYLYEASPPNLRSFVFFIYESSSSLGIFINYTCNLFFSKNTTTGIMIGLMTAYIFLIWFQGETMHYLFKKGDIAGALKAARNVYGTKKEGSVFELFGTEMVDKYKSNENPYGYMMCKVIVIIILHILSQSIGSTFVNQKKPIYMNALGLSRKVECSLNILVTLVGAGFSLFGTDKTSRKHLLVVSFATLALTLGGLSGASRSDSKITSITKAMLAEFFLLIFPSTIGGMPWVIANDIGADVRIVCCALCASFNYSTRIIVTLFLSSLKDEQIYEVFACCSGIGAIFSFVSKFPEHSLSSARIGKKDQVNKESRRSYYHPKRFSQTKFGLQTRFHPYKVTK